MVRRLLALLMVAPALALAPVPANAAPGDFTMTPLDLDFGDVVVGRTRSIDVVVTNVSNTTRTPTFAGGAPADPTNFNGSQDCAGVPIAAGGTCRFTYTFEPTVTGRLSTSTGVSIDSDDFSITLTGRGISPLAASRTSIDFGDVARKRAVTGLVKVVNTSTTSAIGPLNVLRLEPPSTNFSATTDCAGKILSLGASCTVAVTFRPTKRGRALDVAPIEISPTTDPEGGLQTTVALTGCGYPCRVEHARNVSLKLGRGPVATGRVTDLGGAPSCRSGASVKVQYRVSGRSWRDLRITRTDRRGRYRVGIPDLSGRFRAVVVKRKIFDGTIVCLSATSRIRRRK